MQRDRWQNRTTFLLAAIGSAVGLGNLWRFPYLAHKFGGGSFLIPYLIALFLIGAPLLILEFAIGQYFQRGAIKSFGKIHSRLRGIGIAAIFTDLVVVIYYGAVMAWTLVYLIDSFDTVISWTPDPENYFYQKILHISSGIDTIGGINWLLFVFLAIVWIMIYFCIWKGVKSVGKVVLITMPLPIIFLIILFIRGVTLKGASAGILYYITPNFSALLDVEIWLAAASQIFFSLSIGFGIMIAYASYNEKNSDITKNAMITAMSNSAISIFAGFVVFAILGSMATMENVPVGEVVQSGPGLAFVAFPQALSLMPLNWLFSALFFLTLLSLGIDSAFSLVEAINTVISDQFPKIKKHQIAFVICSICFLLGILFVTRAGLYFLDIFDHFVTSYSLVLVGIFECIAVGWLYSHKKLSSYINQVSDWKVGRLWTFCIRFFIPVVLSILLLKQLWMELSTPYGGYPAWAQILGWLTVLIPLCWGLVLSFKPYSNTQT
jgi:NSS family neurotransmitter:Na+ symporter